jgi:CO dehydrogenase/acetyl-CoA synthase gamma subunit (corrinoid Fe-S protein)
MASLDDILTAAKNIVTALNQLGQTYLSVEGSKMSSDITAPTVVMEGQGRIAVISVVVGGSATGSVYDATTTTGTANKILTLPTTVGLAEVNMPVNNGIVVVPGTGQTIAISYS